MEEKKGSNGFFNGFFLGLLAGVVITLLFSTKRGREIVRKLIDESEGGVKELEGLLENSLQDEHIPSQTPQSAYEEEPARPSVPLQFHSYNPEGLKNGYTTHVVVKQDSTPPSQVRRFFRGIPKK